MRVLVLGGDGFCGWPTSLYLSDRGYDVTILDDLSRRKIDVNLEVGSLTPITAIGERLRTWREVSGRLIDFINLDLATEYDRLITILRELRPDAIVHFAEQRAAPYSMRSPATKRYTVDNNVRATHNLLAALVHTGIDAAIAHLGTMGVYGYGWSGSAPIPEGYLTVKVPTPAGELEREILHPANPGSVYHMTKTLDQLMFAFYSKNDGLRITDLHQGIVWGTQTDQTALDERLINRFDYDGDYGTVLNRFLMQAAIGHPLTVHGTGGQTRAFIHISDTVRCVEIAISHPPQAGDRPMVLNQVTETHRVMDLAKLVGDTTGVEIAYLPNPRVEPEENELAVRNDHFLALGLRPTTLSEGLLTEVRDVAARYAHRADPRKIISRSVWRAGMPCASDLIPFPLGGLVASVCRTPFLSVGWRPPGRQRGAFGERAIAATRRVAHAGRGYRHAALSACRSAAGHPAGDAATVEPCAGDGRIAFPRFRCQGRLPRRHVARPARGRVRRGAGPLHGRPGARAAGRPRAQPARRAAGRAARQAAADPPRGLRPGRGGVRGLGRRA